MIADIRDNKIVINERVTTIEELFSDESIIFANKNARKYYNDMCLDNELFERYIVPFHDFCKHLDDNDVDEINLKKANAILSSMAEDSHRIILNKPRRRNVKLLIGLYKVETFGYLLIQQILQRYNPISQKSKAVVFIRSKATKAKFKQIVGIDKLYEEKPGVGMLYQQVSLKKRLEILITSISKARRTEKQILDNLTSYGLGKCAHDACLYYSKRLIHTFFYIGVIDCILDKSNYSMLYTGNNLDRFAYLEEFISKKHGIQLSVIPHGIEYGYRFPKCFVGDVFYTCSANAASALNSLYQTEKFLYDEETAKKMFEIPSLHATHRKVVYFSEPREYEENIKIIKEMFPILKKKSVDFYIKLHPKDIHEHYDKVLDMGVIEITDFNEAISCNICVSRKSTTLLEATYNNSKAVAVLINEKDRCIFNSFPSLQDSRIRSFFNASEAAQYILGALEQS